MKEDDAMFLIRVPASTANLGPGFDSIGLALGLYLDVKGQIAEEWEVIPLTKELSIFPRDDSNYMVVIAKEVANRYGKELRPCRLEVSSEIPLTRGLGSSASAIVAGIELANILADLNLTKKEKNRLASLFEGHPDNAAASVSGGLAVGLHTEEETDVLSFPLEGIKVIAAIPNYELKTEDSRNVLPENIMFSDSVMGSASANLLVASLLSGNWELAGKMMKQDRYHEPYRAHLVPDLARIDELATAAGAFGTALSGAGPTVLCLVSVESAEEIAVKLTQAFPDYTIKALEIDNEGSQTTILDQRQSPTVFTDILRK
jgi:homoserine kinase